MAKDFDFGGLPQTVFVPMVRDIQAGVPLGLGPADQVRILAALAVAEHASAISTKQPNTGDYTIISIRIDNLIAKIRASSGPTGTDVVDLLTEISHYELLWV
jgi:hypothetical protein